MGDIPKTTAEPGDDEGEGEREGVSSKFKACATSRSACSMRGVPRKSRFARSGRLVVPPRCTTALAFELGGTNDPDHQHYDHPRLGER